jgi:hypothetical protein
MMYATDAEMLAALAAPFPPEQIRQKGRFSYIGHALVTERLNAVCGAGWAIQTANVHTSTDPQGALHCAGLTMHLTIMFPEQGAITRTESGGPQRMESFTNEVKNAQSDAFKRCAMRFGVCLYLWDTMVDAEGDEDYRPSPTQKPTANGQKNPADIPNPQVLTSEQANAISNMASRLHDDEFVGSLIARSSHTGSMEAGDLTRREASLVIKELSKRLEAARTIKT